VNRREALTQIVAGAVGAAAVLQRVESLSAQARAEAHTEIGLRQELGEDGRMSLAAFEGCTHPEHQ
jgi:hypothetical protein